MPQYIQVEATPESRKLLESLHPNISVLIQLRYRPATCDSAFCKPIPYVSVMLSQQTPAKGYVKTSSNDADIFLQEPLAELVSRKGLRIVLRTAGFWKWRRFEVAGLDHYLI